jgi:Fur family ferric uptake transcriptional regulator
MSDLETITLKLEARGHRVTPSRRAVVAAVLQQIGHFTVDDVLQSCRGAGRATVFRTIRLLSELGVICRVLLEDGSLHYMVSKRGHHHHLVCTSCGAVEDLAQCAVDDFVRDIGRSLGYEVDGHWLELYGRCAICRDSVPAAVVGK